jgi:hypothetical protein
LPAISDENRRRVRRHSVADFIDQPPPADPQSRLAHSTQALAETSG